MLRSIFRPRSRVPLASALLTTALLLPPAPLSGQQTPEPEQPAAEFGEEVEVTEVFLDVVAVDRKGNVVPGLTAEDFVVRREGEPMEITSVAFYTSRYEDLEHASGPRARDRADEDEAAPAHTPARLPSARYFILFFHDQSGAVTNQSLLTRNTLDAARYARQWVKDEMQPSDWVAVVRFEQSFGLLLDFSQDPELLESAIEAAVTDRRTGRTRPSERRRREASGGPSLLRGLPGSFELPTAAERAYDAVRMVAEASGHIVGRKNLLLFSLGFGQLDSAFRSPDSRYYPPMEEALNANNVAVYPIDLAGPSVDIPNTAFLSQLADDTGGELFKTFHSYGEPFRRISGQTTGYYLITFRAEHPAGASGYQKIEVEAKPRGVQVRARKGYRYGER
jgi:VWFA-related protein